MRIGSVKERGSHGALRSQLSTLGLLSHFLKLLTDYRSVEAIDGDACHAVAPRLRDEDGPARRSPATAERRRVKPIAFFVFHYEVSRTSAASPINEGERMKVRGFRRERPAA